MRCREYVSTLKKDDSDVRIGVEELFGHRLPGCSGPNNGYIDVLFR